MLVKLDKVGNINVHKRANSRLFKKGTPKKNEVAYSGKNIMNNSHFNNLHVVVFNVIDKITPFIKRHPKIGKIVIGLSEKILKNSKDFSSKTIIK
jgi:hypothetical protein